MSSKSLKGQLIAAIAMTLVLTLALGSSTYAWFSMNTKVSATGMKVKAMAEEGIVISNQDNTSTGTWKNSAEAQYTSVAELIPTSTFNTTDWYHSSSEDANDSNSGKAATKLTVTAPEGGNGIGTAPLTEGGQSKDIYLLNTFYIRSSATAMEVSGLYINNVSVETTAGNPASTNLDAALRVAISVGSAPLKIFAPVAGASTTCTINGNQNEKVTYETSEVLLNTINSIPGFADASGLKVQIWVYYEGEDAACKSANLTAVLDTLAVTVGFGTTANPTTEPQA